MYLPESEEFKKYFLLEFTKQLIRNSASVDVYKLVSMIKQKETALKEQEIRGKKEIKEFVKKRVKEGEEYALSVKKEGEDSVFMTGHDKRVIKKNLPSKKTLFIPEQMLPERLQYLRPLPTSGEIDLGKINTLIQDPVVRIIECNGPNQGVIISGVMGKKETNIILTKEEIEEIIKKFSEEAKIPLQEGFFKVALKRLVISAIYSEAVGSKFIIKKMLYAPEKNPSLMNKNVYPLPPTR
jgi:hypothetical protein